MCFGSDEGMNEIDSEDYPQTSRYCNSLRIFEIRTLIFLSLSFYSLLFSVRFILILVLILSSNEMFLILRNDKF
jgi:hypothetical protein